MNKKRTRADKLRYGVPWFRGASRGLASTWYGRLPSRQAGLPWSNVETTGFKTKLKIGHFFPST